MRATRKSEVQPFGYGERLKIYYATIWASEILLLGRPAVR